jgi:hypothetical protein
MNLTETEYRRIVRSIEHRRYIVIDNLLRAYPYSSFDGGGGLSRDQEFNELYKLLDQSITKEEMQMVYPLKIYDQRDKKQAAST